MASAVTRSRGHAVTRLDTIDIFSYMSGLCFTSLDIIFFAVVENAVLVETEMDSIQFQIPVIGKEIDCMHLILI